MFHVVPCPVHCIYISGTGEYLNGVRREPSPSRRQKKATTALTTCVRCAHSTTITGTTTMSMVPGPSTPPQRPALKTPSPSPTPTTVGDSAWASLYPFSTGDPPYNLILDGHSPSHPWPSHPPMTASVTSFGIHRPILSADCWICSRNLSSRTPCMVASGRPVALSVREDQ
jgi:hypothetical protein